MNSASLCSLAGWYDNPISTQFLAPIDCLKIPALYPRLTGGGGMFSCRSNRWGGRGGWGGGEGRVWGYILTNL